MFLIHFCVAYSMQFSYLTLLGVSVPDLSVWSIIQYQDLSFANVLSAISNSPM